MLETVNLVLAAVVAGVPTLLVGIVGLWLLQLGKKDAQARGTGQGWLKWQLIVILGSALILCWQVYEGIHPSNDEVQGKREVREYGL